MVNLSRNKFFLIIVIKTKTKKHPPYQREVMFTHVSTTITKVKSHQVKDSTTGATNAYFTVQGLRTEHSIIVLINYAPPGTDPHLEGIVIPVVKPHIGGQ